MRPTILLLGDNCLDIYYYGDVKRISPEAPIPILDYAQKEQRYGMAANVWQNLEKLGCTVIFTTSGRSIKTRFIDRNTNQHLLRLDEDPPREAVKVPILHTGIHPWDAIAISDYEKGSITQDTIEYIKKYYKGPIFVDTKKRDLAQFDGMFVKINQKEYSEATSLPNEHLITTMGDLGASYKGKLYKAFKSESCDVCGAGDTFFASLIYKYVETKDIEQSIIFANAASSITVKHVGVYSPSLQEIEKVYYG
jgi:bifunctional ADP-heptose synthase (sugar kinase/adenylyltransferase)